MDCFLGFDGPCETCRSCGTGGDLDRRQVQLVRAAEDCAPNCTRCAQVRRMVGEKPISMMAYHAYRSSIDRAMLMCPTKALSLVEAEMRR